MGERVCIETHGYKARGESSCDLHPNAGVNWDFYQYYTYLNADSHWYYDYYYEYCAVCGREVWVGGNDYDAAPHAFKNGKCACGYTQPGSSSYSSHNQPSQQARTSAEYAVPVLTEREWQDLCSEPKVYEFTVILTGSVNIRSGPSSKTDCVAHIDASVNNTVYERRYITSITSSLSGFHQQGISKKFLLLGDRQYDIFCGNHRAQG